MEVFWITFRLANNATYDARYQALIDAVQLHHHGDWWFEPTSFWLIASNSSRAVIAASIARAITKTTDLVLLGSMEYTGATLIGKASELATLRKLVPTLVTV